MPSLVKTQPSDLLLDPPGGVKHGALVSQAKTELVSPNFVHRPHPTPTSQSISEFPVSLKRTSTKFLQLLRKLGVFNVFKE